MSEGLYRWCMVLLFAIFVIGSLVLGSRISSSVDRTGSQMAENGRYIQLDQQKDHFVFGNSATGSGTVVIDTRTGAVSQAKDDTEGAR